MWGNFSRNDLRGGITYIFLPNTVYIFLFSDRVSGAGRAVQKGFRLCQSPSQLDDQAQSMRNSGLLRIKPSRQVFTASGDNPDVITCFPLKLWFWLLEILEIA